MTRFLNPLAEWLDKYLAEQLGTVEGYEYAPTTPTGDGVLVTVGFMPDKPRTLVTITTYDYPEHTAPGSSAASTQLRARDLTPQGALDLANHASLALIANTPRLAAIHRRNIQPIGQDQMGLHEATVNLTVHTLERTTP